MGAERIVGMFEETRRSGRIAFLPYMTAGLPDPVTSPSLFAAMAAAGADGFEVGIPYSDPLMDGPVIQRGSDMALRAGAGLDVSLGVLGRVVTDTALPTLAMTYANPVFRRGVDAFCAALAEQGADGIIVPDLPVEEAAPLRGAVARHGLGLVLFVAPTSPVERVRRVIASDPVFVYAVAEMGVTGERRQSGGHIGALVERIRSVSDVPIVFGVGISGPEQARTAAAAGADGVIIGSALVRRVLEASNAETAAESVAGLVGEVAAALRS